VVLSGRDARPVKLCERDLVKFDKGAIMVLASEKESVREDGVSEVGSFRRPFRLPHPPDLVDVVVVGGGEEEETAAAMLSEVAFDSLFADESFVEGGRVLPMWLEMLAMVPFDSWG
jgi:hypothetical protein